MTSGFWYSVGAYVAWGLFPLYWKQVDTVPAGQVIAHRILWSFLVLAAILSATRRWSALAAAIADRRVVKIYGIAALLITVNWLTYVWAVNSGYIVETSLGYFINPLVNVLFGVLLFGERLHRLQWVAVALAASGVLYLTLSYGSLPWIAIVLALSFGAYGVVKKKASLGAAHGLTVETGLLLLPAVAFLAAADVAGSGAFLHKGASMNMWLAGTGIVTTVPLLMFASAVQRTPLSVMGVLQYLSPSLQLLIGVVVYGEPFTRAHLNGFGLVWAGLVLFGIDGLLSRVRASAWRA